MTKRLLLCDCLGSQTVDADALQNATGLACGTVLTDACGAQVELAAKILAGDDDVIIACQQQAAFFTDLADEIEADVSGFIDIRDRAGWTAPGQTATPKMAALLAEGLLPAPSEKTLDVESHGTCLILGD